MDEKVEKEIVDLLLKNSKTINNFSVTWYGGEPLLAMDVIERLSKEFIEICDKNEIYYSASIITNGYLLTPAIAKKLIDLKIEFMQITIDGSKETHDKRRILANGKGTFDKIISNLKECSLNMPNTALRINTDKKNLE